MPETTIVGELIRRVRISKAMSQVALSRKIGFRNKQSLSNIERGAAPVPPRHIKKIAKALNLDAGKLVALIWTEYGVRLQKESGVKLNGKKKVS